MAICVAPIHNKQFCDARHCKLSGSVLQKWGGGRRGGTDFYLYVDFFETVICNSYPMYDTYVN